MEPSYPTAAENEALDTLRQRGFAVCVFNPEEIGEAASDTLEEVMCSRGWDYIIDNNPPRDELAQGTV